MFEIIIKTNFDNYEQEKEFIINNISIKKSFKDILYFFTEKFISKLNEKYFNQDFNIIIKEKVHGKNEFNNIVNGYVDEYGNIILKDFFTYTNDYNIVLNDYLNTIYHELTHKKFYKIIEINKITCDWDNNKDYHEYKLGERFFNEFFASFNEFDKTNKGDFYYSDIFLNGFNNIEQESGVLINLHMRNMIDSFIRFLPYTLGYNEKMIFLNDLKNSDFKNVLNIIEIENIIDNIENLCKKYVDDVENLKYENILLIGKQLNKIECMFLDYANSYRKRT